MDDIQKLKNHVAALERELNALWALHGMQPPLSVNSGGQNVTERRNDSGRRVFGR